MLCRLRKCCSKQRARKIPYSVLAFIAGLGITLSANQVSAVITVAPASGGSVSPGAIDGNGTLYYFVGTANNTNIYDFTPIDPTATAASDKPGIANVFEFQISSDKTFAAGQRMAVYLWAQPDPTSPRPMPIVSVNGFRCDNGTDGNANCLAKNQINPTANNYYAAYYPNPRATVTIGVNFNTTCIDGANAGSSPNGCNAQGTGMTQPVAGTPAKMQFKVQIAPVPTPQVSAVPSGTVLDGTGTPVTVSLQVDNGSFSCPDNRTLSNTIQTGDGSVLFNPRDANSSPIFSVSTSYGGQAGIRKIIVVADSRGNGVDLTSRYKTGNQKYDEVSSDSTNTLSNISNSTLADPVPYELGFMVRDLTGTILNAGGSCTLTGVYASAIGGALNKDKCFIATAAFGDKEASAVVRFRQLRDEVLLGTWMGDHFVDWYYSWSEAGADWILDRPFLRVPLLYLMIPLQVVTWVLLHPILSVFWMMLCLITLWRVFKVSSQPGALIE